jgi:hypothetical protein
MNSLIPQRDKELENIIKLAKKTIKNEAKVLLKDYYKDDSQKSDNLKEWFLSNLRNIASLYPMLTAFIFQFLGILTGTILSFAVGILAIIFLNVSERSIILILVVIFIFFLFFISPILLLERVSKDITKMFGKMKLTEKTANFIVNKWIEKSANPIEAITNLPIVYNYNLEKIKTSKEFLVVIYTLLGAFWAFSKFIPEEKFQQAMAHLDPKLVNDFSQISLYIVIAFFGEFAILFAFIQFRVREREELKILLDKAILNKEKEL